MRASSQLDAATSQVDVEESIMAHDLFAPEEELVKLLCLGLSNELADLFIQRTKRWPHPLMHDECFTIGTFDDLTTDISTERAFSLIPIALDIVLQQSDPSLFITALSLVMSLARASSTSELPPTLIEKKNVIEARLLENDSECQFYWNLIKEWYRLQ